MLGPNVLLETCPGAKTSTASTTSVPLWHALGRLDFRLSTDKLPVLCVDVASVDFQISLFCKSTPAIRVVANEIPAIVQGFVLNFDMCLQVAVGCTDVITMGTGRGVHGFDVLLHLGVCREAHGSIENIRVEARINLGHLGRTYVAPEAVATVLAVLVADEIG